MASTSRPFDTDHEEIVFFNDEKVGLKAIVAIHDTTLGPSLGGVRMWPYGSEGDALEDVLRLSRGMTYKSAIAGLRLGGGKAVIIGDAKLNKSEALLRSFGRFVDGLAGRYIAAEDVGTSVEDLEIIARETRFAAGLRGRSGDPSPVTAYGVYRGIQAAVAHKLGTTSLAGLTIAVQGLGHVGRLVCERLAGDGANLVVADIDAKLTTDIASSLGARPVDPSTIHTLDVDIYAPCALGAVVNDQTVGEIGAAIVAGAANNQLAEDRHGWALRDRGILYAPDYVINGGGIINISYEFGTYNRERALEHTSRIYDTLLDIFDRAEHDDLPTNVVADHIAEERLAVARQFRHQQKPVNTPAELATAGHMTM